ncbi:MAG: hypothetical protein HKN30_01850 [Sulfitobacter sp.]|nr:hypothetical protein [Sulfitobacter sp.]
MTLLRISAGLSMALFLALAVLSKGWLEPGGALVFDSRLRGYDADAARAYLAALGPDAVALYLGLFRVLDTCFPILLTLSILLLARRAGPVPGVFPMIAVLAYLFFDLRENALVSEMLRAGAGVSDVLVQTASRATVLKWVLLGASALLLAGAHFLAHVGRGRG